MSSVALGKIFQLFWDTATVWGSAGALDSLIQLQSVSPSPLRETALHLLISGGNKEPLLCYVVRARHWDAALFLLQRMQAPETQPNWAGQLGILFGAELSPNRMPMKLLDPGRSALLLTMDAQNDRMLQEMWKLVLSHVDLADVDYDDASEAMQYHCMQEFLAGGMIGQVCVLRASSAQSQHLAKPATPPRAPLLRAVWLNNVRCLQTVLDWYSSPTIFTPGALFEDDVPYSAALDPSGVLTAATLVAEGLPPAALSPLYAAVLWKHYDTARVLLDEGMPPSQPAFAEHNSALAIAAFDGAWDTVAVLLDAGAALSDLANPAKWPPPTARSAVPLMLACFANRMQERCSVQDAR